MQRSFKLVRLFTATAFQYYRVSCWGVVILSFLSMQVTGCGQMKIPPYKADAFNTYKNQVAKNDLHIAVLPMTDTEQQEKYFGVALTDVGVLAVFIIAENQNATKRFLLRDDLVYLQNRITKQIFRKALQTDAADDSNLEGARRTSEIVTAASIILLPVVSLGSIASSLSLATNSVKTKAIQDNLFDKTLYTQTVLPGKTAEGFAFFKLSDSKIDLSDNKVNLRDLLLRVQATDEGAQLTHDFEFGL
jgi:hypothetical protein